MFLRKSRMEKTPKSTVISTLTSSVKTENLTASDMPRRLKLPIDSPSRPRPPRGECCPPPPPPPSPPPPPLWGRDSLRRPLGDLRLGGRAAGVVRGSD